MSTWASPAVRVLAVLAAASLVLAFALATMLPPTATLEQLVTHLDENGMAGLEAFVTGVLSSWTWQRVALPVLARPCWLLPVDFALVFSGIAATLVLRRSRSAERRRG